MKTVRTLFAFLALILSATLAPIAFAREPLQALSLEKAEMLEQRLLRIRTSAHLMGSFKAGTGMADDVIRDSEDAIEEFLPKGSYRVERLDALDGAVELRVLNRSSGKRFVMRAHSGESISISRPGFWEVPGLIIGDAATWSNGRGTFVTFANLSQPLGSGHDHNDIITVGRKTGRFTLTFVAHNAGGDDNSLTGAGVGVAADLGKGFGISVYAEAGDQSRLQIAQGSFARTNDHASYGIFRFAVTKSFKASGIRVAGGVKLVDLDGRGLGSVPDAWIFASASKPIRNSRGEEIGSIDLSALYDAGIDAEGRRSRAAEGFMITLGGGIKF